MNTDSGKSVKSVHDKTGISVHAKTSMGVHDGPESLFTMLRNMHFSFEQLEQLSFVDEIYGGSPYLIKMYAQHKRRYIGAVELNERKQQIKIYKSDRNF